MFAGLLDGPWLVIIIFLASGLINWLAKRRAEQAGQSSEDESSSPPPAATPVDWEERLRRLLGEEAMPPKPKAPPAVPPPIAPAPRAPTGAAPPVIRPATRPPASSTRPLPVEVAPVTIRGAVPKREAAAVAELSRRFESVESARELAAQMAAYSRQRRSVPLAVSLHNPQAARQAFVASLVFGPPKGLES